MDEIWDHKGYNTLKLFLKILWSPGLSMIKTQLFLLSKNLSHAKLFIKNKQTRNIMFFYYYVVTTGINIIYFDLL